MSSTCLFGLEEKSLCFRDAIPRIAWHRGHASRHSLEADARLRPILKLAKAL